MGKDKKDKEAKQVHSAATITTIAFEFEALPGACDTS